MRDAAGPNRRSQALDDRWLADEVIKSGGTVLSVQRKFDWSGMGGHGASVSARPRSGPGQAGKRPVTVVTRPALLDGFNEGRNRREP
jgi:hypothetical protein